VVYRSGIFVACMSQEQRLFWFDYSVKRGDMDTLQASEAHSSATSSGAITVKQDGLYSHYVLAVLLAAYILSFIDRNVMSILVGPIKAEFGISDFQFGLLQGLFFSVFYTFLGLPIGRLADRYSRRWIVTLGVGFWSVMTCACGFAKSFPVLAFARMGVGLGEAALSPPAHSLLSDYFSEKRLPMALAVFTLGITIGGGMAYMLGGWVYAAAVDGVFEAVPILGRLKPWQMTFILVGLPGFIVCLLMMTIKEPPRTRLLSGKQGKAFKSAADANHGGHIEGSETWLSVSEVFSFLLRNRRLYFSLFFAIALLSVLGYGYMSWFVEFMLRHFSVDRKSIGFDFGVMFIVFGSLGALWGGWIAGYLQRKGYRDANMRLVMLVSLCWIFPGVLGPLVPDERWALWAAAPALFFLNSYFGVAIAALQLVTPNQLRAQVSAMLLFMTNLLGLGLGPVLVGLFSDHVFSGPMSLAYALSFLAVLCCPLAALLVWYGLPAYRRVLASRE
jgi:MFS family permease